MGSSLSQQLCCVICQRCRQQEAADGDASETKPILQTPGGTPTPSDTQPPTPALQVPTQGSTGLQEPIQDRQPSADALEEDGQTWAEGWEAAWNPMDFFVAPADEEVEEVEVLTQQEKEFETEEEIKAVPEAQPVGGTALGAELVAEEEQPGSEGALCAGITLQEENTLGLTEISSEAEPGQGCGMEPPAATGEVLTSRDLSPCAVQVAGQPEPPACAEPVEHTARAQAAETSPQPAQRAELACLLGAVSLLTVQDPSGATAMSVAELYSTSAVSWESLCPQWGSLKPPSQLLDLFQQGLQGAQAPAQGVGSLCCAGPVGLSELLQEPGEGALGELGQEGSRGGAAGPEAEPQHGTMQPAVELPEEPAASVPRPAKQDAELLHVTPSLPEVPGSSGETEAENVEV